MRKFAALLLPRKSEFRYKSLLSHPCCTVVEGKIIQLVINGVSVFPYLQHDINERSKKTSFDDLIDLCDIAGSDVADHPARFLLNVVLGMAE